MLMLYTTIDSLLNTSQGQRSLTGAANAGGSDNGMELHMHTPPASNVTATTDHVTTHHHSSSPIATADRHQ